MSAFSSCKSCIRLLSAHAQFMLLWMTHSLCKWWHDMAACWRLKTVFCVSSLVCSMPLLQYNCILYACRQVAAQSKLFISAGFETTALTLAYCIYLLSKHPKQQAKLQHEVDNFKGRIGYGDLESLPYTSAVINESLRLYPPSTTTVRRAAQDVKVSASKVVTCNGSRLCAQLR